MKNGRADVLDADATLHAIEGCDLVYDCEAALTLLPFVPPRRLAFLAPDLVNAAIDDRLLHGMGVTRLTDCPPNGRASTKCSILVSANRGLRCPESYRRVLARIWAGPVLDMRLSVCAGGGEKNTRLCLDECRKIRGKFVRRHRALPQRMR